jgi:hypothetical protein
VALRRPTPIDRHLRQDLAEETAELRRLAEARYSEVDLLVAALREHIADLRAERDRLVGELARTRQEHARLAEVGRLASSKWLERGSKPVHH